ncbi:MAG: hypothetical protein LBC04_03955 [Holosporaceae bacterium]|jgi:hypothetical protein|nr:hypothetical protein [Holosporaceae bacterium]
MHKVKKCILIFFIIALSILCFARVVKLNELKNQKNGLIASKALIDSFVKEIEKSTFSCLKAKDKFYAKNYDVKKSIDVISQRLILDNVLIKLRSSNNLQIIEEIKIQTNRESKIYQFIEELFFELPGMVQFKRINISPGDKGKLVAIIQLHIFMPEECPGLATINHMRQSYHVDSIRLFERAKTHKLFCTIPNSKAYINGSWFQIGDPIDGFKLMGVEQNSIEIQDDSGHKTTIKFGAVW